MSGLDETRAAFKDAGLKPPLRWRSLLFIPVTQTHFLDRAHERGADAIVLDLEDSVPQADKATARSLLPKAIDDLADKGLPLLVRINRDWRDAFADIEAAVRPGVCALVLPKVPEPGAVRVVSEIVAALEEERQIATGTIGLVPMIEDAAALAVATDIARASARVRAITLGAEDFALSVGCETASEALLFPSAMIVQAAAIAGIVPLGLLGTIADYADQSLFRDCVRRSRAFGFRGSLLIHPTQVSAANEEFSPTQDDIAWARAVVGGEAASSQSGAFALDGRMVDLPILLRARRVLAEASAGSPEYDLASISGGKP